MQELQRLLEGNVHFVASGDDGGVASLGRRNRRIEAHEGTFSPQKEPPATTKMKAAAPSRLAGSQAADGVAAGKAAAAAAAAARNAKGNLDAAKQARLNRLRREVEIIGAPGSAEGGRRVTRAQAASAQGPEGGNEEEEDADDEGEEDEELSGDSADGEGEEDDEDEGEEEEEEGTEMWHTGRKYELRERPKTQVKRFSPRPRSNKPR